MELNVLSMESDKHNFFHLFLPRQKDAQVFKQKLSPTASTNIKHSNMRREIEKLRLK